MDSDLFDGKVALIDGVVSIGILTGTSDICPLVSTDVVNVWTDILFGVNVLVIMYSVAFFSVKLLEVLLAMSVELYIIVIPSLGEMMENLLAFVMLVENTLFDDILSESVLPLIVVVYLVLIVGIFTGTSYL